MSTEPELRRVVLTVCDLCLNGRGGECHVPGCAFWMKAAPDVPLSPESGIVLSAEEVGVLVEVAEWAASALQFSVSRPKRLRALDILRSSQ